MWSTFQERLRAQGGLANQAGFTVKCCQAGFTVKCCQAGFAVKCCQAGFNHGQEYAGSPFFRFIIYSGFETCFVPSAWNVGCWGATHIPNHSFGVILKTLNRFHATMLPCVVVVVVVVYSPATMLPCYHVWWWFTRPLQCYHATMCSGGLLARFLNVARFKVQ